MTPRDLAAEIAAAARELAREFAEVLPERVEALAAALAEAKLAPGNAEKREHVIHLAHRLAGTAGSHGFEDVGVAARAIEDLLVDHASHASLEAAHVRRLDDRLAAVKEGAESVAARLAAGEWA